jgi:hypothetical protein
MLLLCRVLSVLIHLAGVLGPAQHWTVNLTLPGMHHILFISGRVTAHRHLDTSAHAPCVLISVLALTSLSTSVICFLANIYHAEYSA